MREHGTRSMYVGGCRCEPCREAQRRYDYARLHPSPQTHVHPCWFCSRSFASELGAHQHMGWVH